MSDTYTTGARGCAGRTKRYGVDRHCAQKAVVTVGGKGYCYYHNPDDPKRFGEGYCSHSRGYCDKGYHESPPRHTGE